MKKAILISLTIVTTLSHAQQNTRKVLDSLICAAYSQHLFNGNVLVIDHNNEIYRKAIGIADPGTQALLTDQHRFHIGSIAKEFNAVAVMMLQEQGRLQLTDKVSRYLPELPAWSQTITIQNLLQYSSGLPNLPWKNIKGAAAAMDSLKQIQKLDFEAGTQYAYNNTNTLLQRQIVERITGIKFSEFVTTRMLLPLGMKASVVDPTVATPLMSISFNDKQEATPLGSAIEGWTAVTLDDFVIWQKSLEQFSLISAASTQILLTPFAPGRQCGLGGGVMLNNQLLQHTHDGTSLNYQALLMTDKARGQTIILLTNNKQNKLYDLAAAIKVILEKTE